MKIVIVSDSHSYISNLETILEAEKGFDAILHLGDGASDLQFFPRYTSRKPVYSVKGNCDFGDDSLPIRFISYFDKLKFIACHGNTYNVKTSLISLFYAAKEYDCKLALYGHTHTPHKEESDGICMFNPGSVANGSYGILEVSGESFNIYHKNI